MLTISMKSPYNSAFEPRNRLNEPIYSAFWGVLCVFVGEFFLLERIFFLLMCFSFQQKETKLLFNFLFEKDKCYFFNKETNSSGEAPSIAAIYP